MTKEHKWNMQPVPEASQLAIIPFLAAIDGFLREGSQVSSLRLTIQRAVNFDGLLWLQQVCPHLTDNGLDTRFVGRSAPVSVGLYGVAFTSGKIWRTKRFEAVEEIKLKLKSELEANGYPPKVDDVELSYLSIPFLGPKGEPVLTLFAASKEFNFFANDERVRQVVAMGRGLCRHFDSLESEPFTNLRNFPQEKGIPADGEPLFFASIAEKLDNLEPPKFQTVRSFNYNAQ